MIKIKQNEVTKNFLITVSNFETVKETYQVASSVKRLLTKHGVTTVSVAKNDVVTVDFSSYNDNVKADDILWILVDSFNVGYGFWDNFGIYIESLSDGVSVATNKDGSTIKINHKNAHKLKDDDDFPFSFAGGLQYFNVFKDSVRIDFPGSHESALQIYNDLQDLLDSLD